MARTRFKMLSGGKKWGKFNFPDCDLCLSDVHGFLWRFLNYFKANKFRLISLDMATEYPNDVSNFIFQFIHMERIYHDIGKRRRYHWAIEELWNVRMENGNLIKLKIASEKMAYMPINI